MVTSGDHNQVFQPACDINLIVDDNPEVTGGHPPVIVRRTLCARVFRQARSQGVAERLLSLFRAVQVAGGSVITMRPNLADGAIGQFGTRFGIHDHHLLRAHNRTVGHERHGLLMGLVDNHGSTITQFLTIHHDNAGIFLALRSSHQQGGLGQAIRGTNHITGQTKGCKSIVELLDGPSRDRLRSDNHAVKCGQVHLIFLAR